MPDDDGKNIPWGKFVHPIALLCCCRLSCFVVTPGVKGKITRVFKQSFEI